jgi:hypothetical protein
LSLQMTFEKIIANNISVDKRCFGRSFVQNLQEKKCSNYFRSKCRFVKSVPGPGNHEVAEVDTELSREWNEPFHPCDQIGRIHTICAIVYFGQFSEMN